MKRRFFIASTASIVFIGRPLLTRAEHLNRQQSLEPNAESSGWRNPAWFCASAVVWLDTASGVYYYKNDHRYGRTEQGAYSCEDEAIAAGHRASFATGKEL